MRRTDFPAKLKHSKQGIYLELIHKTVATMEYDVISESDIKTLIKTVNDMIRKGWKPQGGIQQSSQGERFYMQAMVKNG